MTIIAVKRILSFDKVTGIFTSGPELWVKNIFLLQLFAELFDAEIFLRRVFPTSLQMLCKNQIKSPLLNQQLAAGAGERAGRGQERREFCSKCYKPSTQTRYSAPFAHLNIWKWQNFVWHLRSESHTVVVVFGRNTFNIHIRQDYLSLSLPHKHVGETEP